MRMDPAIDRIRGARADARHAHGGRLAQAGLDEAPDGHFRRHAPALGAPHAIGQRRHQADS